MLGRDESHDDVIGKDMHVEKEMESSGVNQSEIFRGLSPWLLQEHESRTRKLEKLYVSGNLGFLSDILK